MNCRGCGQTLPPPFLDLGEAPASNAYLETLPAHGTEARYLLRLRVCHRCWLVQTEDYTPPTTLFPADYAYFSSASSSWLEHCREYCQTMRRELSLTPRSLVVEIACNDGYLLKNFVEAGIPCLGIEPTAATAAAARRLGIPVREEFFGARLARRLLGEGIEADLVLGNNVYAHVPDLADFTSGLALILRKGGTLTLEFPHLLRLLEECQFDTVYHEHFSYFSCRTARAMLERHGLKLLDAEKIRTHGGSLRLRVAHLDDPRQALPSVAQTEREEAEAGLFGTAPYREFQTKAVAVRDGFREFLRQIRSEGKKIAGYGAAAKGNTLLNFSGVGREEISFVCDAAPSKQGKFLPGSHIPIRPPEVLRAEKPDILLLFPWNLEKEVARQVSFLREWGGRLFVAVPKVREVALPA